MADVKISQLTQGLPAGNNLLPYSTGSSTLAVATSAIFENVGSIINVNGKSNQSLIILTNDAALNAGGNGLRVGLDNNLNAFVNNSKAGSLSFSTTNIERMKIDSNGVITIPYQPAFHVWNKTAQSLGGGAVMQFNEPSTNPTRVFNQGNYYANNKFTAPVAGVYQFSTNVLLNSTTRGSYWGVGLVLNGTDTIEFSYAAGGSLQQSLNISATIKLAANDFIDVRASTDGTINIDNSGTFSGHLVG